MPKTNKDVFTSLVSGEKILRLLSIDKEWEKKNAQITICLDNNICIMAISATYNPKSPVAVVKYYGTYSLCEFGYYMQDGVLCLAMKMTSSTKTAASITYIGCDVPCEVNIDWKSSITPAQTIK